MSCHEVMDTATGTAHEQALSRAGTSMQHSTYLYWHSTTFKPKLPNCLQLKSNVTWNSLQSLSTTTPSG